MKTFTLKSPNWSYSQCTKTV